MSVIKSNKILRGIFIDHHKNTKDDQTVKITLPKSVEIPMIQHMGVPCEPLVKKGDYVFVGQKIGESNEYFSVPIHASCSGTITDISETVTANGAICKNIIIQTDGKQVVEQQIKKPEIKCKDDFINAIKESGLVGLGGAGFPTSIKLGYKDIDKVTKLVINAAECEPYITSDFRECVENTTDILDGIKMVQRQLNINEVYIGVENNKPEIIKILEKETSDDTSIKIVSLKTIYPQGAEKSIIYTTTGVVVKEGKLPADCGVIVLNISTVGFIGKFLKSGMPLINRRITIDGDIVSKPINLEVPIGTQISDIIKFCNIPNSYSKILMGGPMMGMSVANINTSIIKNNNAIIFLSESASTLPTTTACIRCGKCTNVCPMILMPAKLEKSYDTKNIELLNELKVSLCINCGCCTYICPAKRHLAQKIQLAKDIAKNRK